MAEITPLGRWLRETRLRKGFKAARQLSLAASLDPGYVSQTERGIGKPKPENAKRLADALRLTKAERSAFYRLVSLSKVPEEFKDEFMKLPDGQGHGGSDGRGSPAEVAELIFKAVIDTAFRYQQEHPDFTAADAAEAVRLLAEKQRELRALIATFN